MEVFAPAIEQRAVAILVVHNHPSNINGGATRLKGGQHEHQE
jgi:hypothetical protein